MCSKEHVTTQTIVQAAVTEYSSSPSNQSDLRVQQLYGIQLKKNFRSYFQTVSFERLHQREMFLTFILAAKHNGGEKKNSCAMKHYFR